MSGENWSNSTAGLLNTSNLSCLMNLSCTIQALSPGDIIEGALVTLFSVVGSFGNLLVILSIVAERRVFKSANFFVINLAVADLVVTAFFLPTILLNIIEMGNALPMPACQVAGYLVTVACACSVSSMAFIALSRYCFVVHNNKYKVIFRRRCHVLMVLFTWLASNLIASPTLFGWSGLIYDEKMEQCGWDDQTSRAYNVLLMISAIFLPLVVILFCYWRLLTYVRKSGDWYRKQGQHTHNNAMRVQLKTRLRREIALLKTLAVSVVFFLLCWTPYGVVVLFFPITVPAVAKKIAARLGLFNSSMNFIIYGVMNQSYRKGYIHFFKKLTCTKEKLKHVII